MSGAWPQVAISEVATVVNGGTPKSKVGHYWDGDIAWITPAEMGNLDSPFLRASRRTLTAAGLESSSAKVVPPNSVILSTRAPIGHLVINEVPMAFNQGCRALVPGEQIEPKFLYYVLLSRTDELNALGTGTTFLELSAGKLKELLIPLPSLDEQRRIVAKLDDIRVEIRSQQEFVAASVEQASALLNESITHAIARVTSSRSPVRALGTVLDELIDHRGKTPKKLGGEFVEDGVQVISAANIRNGRIDRKHRERFISESIFERWMPVMLKPGDVLLTSEAPLGQVAVVENEEPLGLGQRPFGLRPSESQLISGFLRAFLISRLGQSQLVDRQTGATAVGIRQAELRKIEVPVPPLSDQNEIANMVDEVEDLVSRYRNVAARKLLALEEFWTTLLRTKVGVET